jgi:hypothetical protein
MSGAAFYPACHSHAPKKAWRHKCCRKKTFRHRNVFFNPYKLNKEKLNLGYFGG